MNKLIHSFFISDTIEIVFQIFNFKGATYADIRQFTHSDRFVGFTKHGLTFSDSQICKFIEILSSSREAILGATKAKPLNRMYYKNNSFIIVSLVESNLDDNPVCVDIREYVESPQYKGFTKKGFRIPVNLIDEFVSGCKLLQEALRTAK